MKVTPLDSSNVPELRADSRAAQKAVAADPSSVRELRRVDVRRLICEGELIGASLRRLLLLCLMLFLSGGAECLAQTVFLDFNTVGQYTNNFNPWNDNGGLNGGNYSRSEERRVGK